MSTDESGPGSAAAVPAGAAAGTGGGDLPDLTACAACRLIPLPACGGSGRGCIYDTTKGQVERA